MFKMIFSPDFDADIDNVNDYISCVLCNPAAADRLLDKVKSAIKTIKTDPLLHPYHHSGKIAAKGYRFAVVGNYILFYTVDEESKTIHIARFIYGGRDIENML